MNARRPRNGYPAPKRLSHRSAVEGTTERGAESLVLADGRPCRAERWATGGCEFVTLIFSRRDLENATIEQLLRLLDPTLSRLHIAAKRRKLGANDVHRLTDEAGEAVYSVVFLLSGPG